MKSTDSPTASQTTEAGVPTLAPNMAPPFRQSNPVGRYLLFMQIAYLATTQPHTFDKFRNAAAQVLVQDHNAKLLRQIYTI